MKNVLADPEFSNVHRRTESAGGTNVSIIFPKHRKQTA
jgi:hypothetical protein